MTLEFTIKGEPKVRSEVVGLEFLDFFPDIKCDEMNPTNKPDLVVTGVHLSEATNTVYIYAHRRKDTE